MSDAALQTSSPAATFLTTGPLTHGTSEGKLRLLVAAPNARRLAWFPAGGEISMTPYSQATKVRQARW